MIRLLTRISACVSILLVAIGTMQAGDWPQFRGPGGTAISEETNLPEKWSEKEGIRWKADLPGRGLSNPVIAGGKVYVTASSGYKESKLHVLAFDEATGKKLWERTIWSTGGTQCHPKTCMAAPTPVTDGKAVYALFATTDLCAFDSEGKLLWYRSLVRDYPEISNQVGMAASPILHDNVLLVPMDNVGDSFLLAIDKKTGKNKWKVERPKEICWTTPLLLKNGSKANVLFQTGEELTAYDIDSGRISWKYKEKGLSTIPSPALSSGSILVPGKSLVCLKPGSDQTSPEVTWKSNKMQTDYASHMHYQDRIYAPNGAGVLICADAVNGKVLWQERLTGPFAASPVAGDGKIYLVNEEGTTFVVQAGAEPKLLSTNEIKDTILATPAIANGAIFLRSDKALYCIGGKKKTKP
jgi:outer membrane protein assembly factor BamB